MRFFSCSSPLSWQSPDHWKLCAGHAAKGGSFPIELQVEGGERCVAPPAPSHCCHIPQLSIHLLCAALCRHLLKPEAFAPRHFLQKALESAARALPIAQSSDRYSRQPSAAWHHAQLHDHLSLVRWRSPEKPLIHILILFIHVSPVLLKVS